MVKKKRDDTAGLFVPAGLFLGLGFGAIFNQWVAGTLLGLGLGFVVMAVVKNWK